jgi:cell division protein FtsQ
MTKTKLKAVRKTARGSVRRRVRPSWLRPAIVTAGALALLGGIAGGGTWFVQSGKAAAALDQLENYYETASRSAGFVVREVLVEGRTETPRSQLLSALQVERGDLMLGFDVETARKRLEALGWVAAARVERRLPDTIRVSIVERVPVAVWQHKGKFLLVDAAGVTIGADGVERFPDLKIVIGDDAPLHAQALIAMLQRHPELMKQTKAAIRTGKRRWNLRMESGVDVRLPENDAFEAWDRLAKYEKQHGLLARDIASIDLRLPDRVVVKVRPAGAVIKSKSESHT